MKKIVWSPHVPKRSSGPTTEITSSPPPHSSNNTIQIKYKFHLLITSQLSRLLFHQELFLSIQFDRDGEHFRSPPCFRTFRSLHLKTLQNRDILSCLYSKRAFHHLISYYPVFWTMIQSVRSRLDNRKNRICNMLQRFEIK